MNPAPVDMVNICKYPSVYRVLYIPGGAGFLSENVVILPVESGSVHFCWLIFRNIELHPLCGRHSPPQKKVDNPVDMTSTSETRVDAGSVWPLIVSKRLYPGKF